MRLVDIGRDSRCDAQKTEGERRVAADGSADSCTDCLCLTAVWTLVPTVFVDYKVVPAHRLTEGLKTCWLRFRRFLDDS